MNFPDFTPSFTLNITLGFLLWAAGVACGYGYSRIQRRRKLNPKPIALPGMSREEHETEEFIEVMRDREQDSQELKRWKPKRARNHMPLAIAATPHSLTTYGMHRIRLHLNDRESVPVRRL